MIFEDVHYIEVDAETRHGPTLVRIHHGQGRLEEAVASVSAEALIIRSLRTRSEQADAAHLRIFFDPVAPVAQLDGGLLCIMPGECLSPDAAVPERDTEPGWHWGAFSR